MGWAEELDLATAWATGHEGLRRLKQRQGSLKVRAVDGPWGNQTDPVALRISRFRTNLMFSFACWLEPRIRAATIAFRRSLGLVQPPMHAPHGEDRGDREAR